MTPIRPLSVEDRTIWQPLWEGYLRFYRSEPDPETVSSTFTRLTDPATTSLAGLLAVGSEGRAVGLAHVVFHESTWTPRPTAYLNDLYVDPSERGTGAGRALIEATYALAGERDCAEVYWLTQEYNSAARSLYDTVATLTSFRVYEHTL